ncbi:transcriptional regulator ATRX homolog isoform X2 [Linepithema humile]|uniref:transcriptional regulator ATRX homolog isoform X2 n=2 Tax=Linepithema humile TaxID=83485 RepID=UPI00351E52FB
MKKKKLWQLCPFHGKDKLSCKWPPKKFSTEKITRLIMGLSKPTSEFNNYPVTVMYAYDKYHSARRACKLAEDNSNLDTAAGETDLEGPRKKRKTKRLYDPEESDESPQVIKKKLSRITNSDSDEDEISNVQKIKETVRTLVQKKKNYSALQHQTSFLPLKHSSKNRIVKLAKQPTNTNVSCSQVSNQNLTYLFRNEVDSAIDSSAIDSSEIDSSVVTKNIALSTDSLSINSSSISDRDEFSNTSVLTQNTLFENDSNDGIILPKAGILKTDCNTSKKTLCAKTLLSQTSIPTMNDKKCEILLQVLIEQIEEVSGKLDHVNMSLTRVYAKLLPEDPAPIKPKDLPNLPLKNEEAETV